MEMTLWKREKWLGQKCGTCWRSENCQNLSYPSSSLTLSPSSHHLTLFFPFYNCLRGTHSLLPDSLFLLFLLPLPYCRYRLASISLLLSRVTSLCFPPPLSALSSPSFPSHLSLLLSFSPFRSLPLLPFFPSPLTECCVRSFHPQQCEMRFEYGSRSICGLPKPPSPTPIHVHKNKAKPTRNGKELWRHLSARQGKGASREMISGSWRRQGG